MRRRVFNLAAAVSLVLFAASVVLWVRSYRGSDSVGNADVINFTRSDPLYWIISRRGQAVFCRQTGRNWDETELRSFRLAGINFGGSRGADGSMLWNLEVPFWLIAASTALLPALRLEQWRRRRRGARRQSDGRCYRCGYDLRATPDRCPECGAVPGGCAHA